MKTKHLLRYIVITFIAYLVFYLYLLLIESAIAPMLDIDMHQYSDSLGGLIGLSKLRDGLIVFIIYLIGASGLAVFGALSCNASIPIYIWVEGALPYSALLIFHCPNIVTSKTKTITIVANVIVLLLLQVLPYLTARFIHDKKRK